MNKTDFKWSIPYQLVYLLDGDTDKVLRCILSFKEKGFSASNYKMVEKLWKIDKAVFDTSIQVLFDNELIGIDEDRRIYPNMDEIVKFLDIDFSEIENMDKLGMKSSEITWKTGGGKYISINNFKDMSEDDINHTIDALKLLLNEKRLETQKKEFAFSSADIEPLPF